MAIGNSRLMLRLEIEFDQTSEPRLHGPQLTIIAHNLSEDLWWRRARPWARLQTHASWPKSASEGLSQAIRELHRRIGANDVLQVEFTEAEPYVADTWLQGYVA